MRQIEIQFPGVKALDKVDFTLRAGEIHSLLGENGAGKSTLIKCLTGVNRMDAGTITFMGNSIRPQSPQEAMGMGISTVYQEVNLCPNLTVAENIFVGRQPMKHGQIDWKTITKRARELMARFHQDIDVSRPLSYYSTAVQQMVAIARAVDVQAKVLILDEPTSSLDDNEVQLLFDVMRDLKAEGMGIIFITHFLDQVFAISDRLTILRNGHLVGSYDIGDITKVELVTQMVGKDMDTIFNLKRASVPEDAPDMLNASHIGSPGQIEDISVTVKKGELIGFAGLSVVYLITALSRGQAGTNSGMIFGAVAAAACAVVCLYCYFTRKTDITYTQYVLSMNDLTGFSLSFLSLPKMLSVYSCGSCFQLSNATCIGTWMLYSLHISMPSGVVRQSWIIPCL